MLLRVYGIQLHNTRLCIALLRKLFDNVWTVQDASRIEADQAEEGHATPRNYLQ